MRIIKLSRHQFSFEVQFELKRREVHVHDTCSMRVHVAWCQDSQDTVEPPGLDPPYLTDSAYSMPGFARSIQLLLK